MEKIVCADYDSMGNHGRFPKSKNSVEMKVIKRQVLKLALWWSYKFAKKEKKSIWKLD